MGLNGDGKIIKNTHDKELGGRERKMAESVRILINTLPAG